MVSSWWCCLAGLWNIWVVEQLGGGDVLGEVCHCGWTWRFYSVLTLHPVVCFLCVYEMWPFNCLTYRRTSCFFCHASPAVMGYIHSGIASQNKLSYVVLCQSLSQQQKLTNTVAQYIIKTKVRPL